MKLITAQEIQSMNKTELQNFLNSLSMQQAQREIEDTRCRSVGNVSLNLSLHSEYGFD